MDADPICNHVKWHKQKSRNTRNISNTQTIRLNSKNGNLVTSESNWLLAIPAKLSQVSLPLAAKTGRTTQTIHFLLSSTTHSSQQAVPTLHRLGYMALPFSYWTDSSPFHN